VAIAFSLLATAAARPRFSLARFGFSLSQKYYNRFQNILILKKKKKTSFLHSKHYQWRNQHMKYCRISPLTPTINRFSMP
jgi:hypothetical protein